MVINLMCSYRVNRRGYAFVTITLPLGDITADQTRALADISRKYVKDTIRATVEQKHRPPLGNDDGSTGTLSRTQRGSVSAIRGQNLWLISPLARVLTPANSVFLLHGVWRRTYAAISLIAGVQNEIKDFRIKISGCPNSCGQHHIANIGFFGSSRRMGEHIAPYYQVLLGGHMIENASSYGLATGKIHGKYIPAFIEELTGKYTAERNEEESFTDYVARLGKAEIKQILSKYDKIPSYEEAPEFYVDTGDTKDYQLKTGVGECAGEVVALVSMKLEEADRLIYESGLSLEDQTFQESANQAFNAMIKAADGLLTTAGLQYIDDATTVDAFRTNFFEPGNFFPGYGAHIFKATEEDASTFDHELAHRRVEEATLFVEESHNVYNRMRIKQEEEEESRRKKRRSRPARKPRVVKKAKPVEEIVDSLDLKGVACPFNYVQAKIRLETMQLGQLLEVTIDDGEPIENVPTSLTNDGHEIVDTKKVGKHYRLTVRKGE